MKERLPGDEENQAQIQEDSRRPSLAKKGLAIICGTVMGASAMLYLSPENIKADLAQAKCEEPSPEAYEAVDKLLSQPRDIKTILERKEKLIRIKEDLAVLQDLPTDSKAHTAKYMNKANRLLSPYGVEVVLDSKHKDIKNTNFAEGILDKTEKQGISDIVRGTLYLPKSYIEYSGLKKVIASRYPYEKHASAFVHMDNSGTVYYNLLNRGTGRTIGHEVYHLIDNKECGDYYEAVADESFSSLNKGARYSFIDISKESYKPHPYSLESAYNEEKLWVLNNQKEAAIEKNDRKTYDDLRKDMAKHLGKITFVSDYSNVNPVEDKAELGESFTTPDNSFPDLLNPATPKLRAKTIFMLARLYEKSPKSAEQIINIAGRPTRDLEAFNNEDTFDVDRKVIENYSRINKAMHETITKYKIDVFRSSGQGCESPTKDYKVTCWVGKHRFTLDIS